MTVPEQRKLQRIDPREAWRFEALEFTPWPSGNIDRLGEALGLDLEVEAEGSVGVFWADWPVAILELAAR